MFLPCNDYSQRAFHDLIPRFEYGKDDQQRRLGSNGNRGPARALDERSRPVCAVEPARSHQPPACAAADRLSSARPPHGAWPGRPAPCVKARHHPRAELAFRARSEEHTSELQSLMRSSYAVFCLQTTIQLTLSLLYTTSPLCYY